MLCFLGASVPVLAAPTPAVALLDDDAEPSCDIDFSLTTGTTGNFHLEFDRQNDASFYALDCSPKGASFSLVQNGKAGLLKEAPVAWAASNRATLQRRPFGMNLIVNGQVVLRAYDPTWTRGKIGTLNTGAWKATDLRVQPVEPIRFDDDFTRAGDGGDLDWKTATAKWTLSAASAKVSARNADMSANPFAFAVDNSKTWTTALAGRKFWNDYDARVAVRSNSGGSIGIAADALDKQNYLAFTLDSNARDKPGTRRLTLMRDGKATILAQAEGGFVPRQWLQLGIRTSPGFVEGLLDGVPVLRAKTDAFGHGGVALLAKGAPALWDDVSVRSYDFLRAQFAPMGAWNGTGWKLTGGEAISQTPNAALTTGRADWNNYRVLLSTPWTGTSSGAVVAGWRDSKNYALIRWAGSESGLAFKNKLQAVEVKNGTEKVVASAPFDSPAPTRRLEIDAENGAFSLAFGGHARVAMPLLSAGKFGLRSVQNGARFSDAVVFFPPTFEPPKVATRFVNDGFMLGWASSQGEWPATPDKSGLQFWNTAELFGDWSLEFPWRSRWHGKMEAALFADRGDFNSGLTLRAQPSDDGLTIDWTLAHDTTVLATAQSKVADLPGADAEGATLTLSWKNGLLSLRGEKGVVFSLPVQAPHGSAIAMRASGFRVRTNGLKLWSANRDDFTFADAPTDFYAPSGKWSVFSRWPCYGDWSFFGGTGRQPRLWTKRAYSGDIVAEYYAHPQMDLPKEPGYSHPGDLNVTLCGDGQSPASGYSFLVSGHDNTRTQILRDGKLVADNTSDEAWFHDTINHNEKWHRTWVYVRAQAKRATQNGKTGVLVSLTVNNDQLAQFFDPKPLESWKGGGRVCLWTLDSTIMLARAKIEAQGMGALSTPATLRDTTPSPGLDVNAAQNALARIRPVVENDEVTTHISEVNGRIRVENEIAGGPFSVKLTSQPQTITPKSKLSFDWRTSDGTHVDVYLRTGDDWRLVELDGDQRVDAMTPSVGKMTRGQTKDGRTPLSFDLGAALKGVSKVDEIRIGALHGDAYRWQGFDGNPEGAWYEVKGLELK